LSKMRIQLRQGSLPPLSDDEFKEALLSSRGGDNKARDKIIRSNLSLVYSIAQRFVRPDYELEDLFQIGSIGLLKAIDNFNLDYQVKFSTYAVPMIMGEIRRYLRDQGSIKVSRNIKQLAARILKTRDSLTQGLGREPKVGEVAQRLNLTREEVVATLEAVQPLVSLQQPQDEEGDYCLLDKIPSEERANNWLDKLVLKDFFRTLPEREKKIIALRFFQNKTQTEVAKLLGLSQVQISRLEKKIIRQIKNELI